MNGEGEPSKKTKVAESKEGNIATAAAAALAAAAVKAKVSTTILSYIDM